MLTKPIRRECYVEVRGRRIIVMLEPGDVIMFRRKGTREEYRIPVVVARHYAVYGTLAEPVKRKRGKR